MELLGEVSIFLISEEASIILRFDCMNDKRKNVNAVVCLEGCSIFGQKRRIG